MSKSDILEWFSFNAEELQTERILQILGFAILIGLIIFAVYRLAYRGVAYNPSFNVGNVVLVVISATIMLMIASNIAISLGMVGALSIVRFRTAIKDPQDTVYIFWAVVEGLCVGARLERLAVLSALLIGAVLLCGSFYDAFRQKYLIIVRGNDFSQSDVTEAIKSSYRRCRIRSVNSEVTHMELVCEVVSRKGIGEETIAAVRGLAGVRGVDWLAETSGYVG